MDAIEACHQVSTLARLFARSVAAYGYSASACGAFRPIGGDAKPEFYFCNWPETWTALYTQRNLAPHDFTITEVRRQSSPYTWLTAKAARRLSAKEEAFWKEVTEMGWADGLSIPIHGPGGQLAFVTMTGGERTATPVQRAHLRCLAILTHERARKLCGFEREQGPRDLLTPRELECLRKVGAGKSDRAIGEDLGIARTTVKYYLDRARQKLGARTRAQAFAQLALWGET
ncbi:LuxR family transcriptional regulator [Bradyrhizobium sp. Arg237L]|uniref:LuxR family transcriptional regulator n=1 Tax=Bradyrhizobium sp. Arg237L TaxID=3003352 RepID=UPI00249E4CE6|nr:LuxR family transcriptional regulator [Bradyrhizobium sp. Arg237L]MDI4235697.1 LuxR family transcriptional regulator [Bradyrhizobium sp. Arg237L]